MTPPDTHATDTWVALPGGGTGFLRASYRKRFAAAGLVALEDFLKVEGDALSKPGLGTRYRARLRLGDTVVYLKRFAGDKLLDRFRRWHEDGVWSSPAERELRVAEALCAAGIPVPRALAWGTHTASGWEQSFVVLSAAPGEPADRLLQRRGDATSLRKLAQRLAELARSFHAAGWRHRDFYLCHIFVMVEAGDIDLTLIDLQRVFRPRWRAGRWQVKDLAQLEYSAREAQAPLCLRLYFFARYARGTSRANQRRLLQAIQAKVAAMAGRTRKFT